MKDGNYEEERIKEIKCKLNKLGISKLLVKTENDLLLKICNREKTNRNITLIKNTLLREYKVLDIFFEQYLSKDHSGRIMFDYDSFWTVLVRVPEIYLWDINGEKQIYIRNFQVPIINVENPPSIVINGVEIKVEDMFLGDRIRAFENYDWEENIWTSVYRYFKENGRYNSDQEELAKEYCKKQGHNYDRIVFENSPHDLLEIIKSRCFSETIDNILEEIEYVQRKDEFYH